MKEHVSCFKHRVKRKAIDVTNPMRFFGARFITIWVLPLAITGIFMEYLFVSPITGRIPFG